MFSLHFVNFKAVSRILDGWKTTMVVDLQLVLNEVLDRSKKLLAAYQILISTSAMQSPVRDSL